MILSNMKAIFKRFGASERLSQGVLRFVLLFGIAIVGFAGVQFYRHGPRFFGIHLNRPQRAFYYWKTRWSAPPEILAQLKHNKINILYMRFFDVEWVARRAEAKPVSPLDISAPLPVGVDIVPVVYFTNEVFLKISYAQIEDLADKVWKKVSQMSKNNRVTVAQLQLDCDWSDRSRRSYFHFTDLLRQKLNAVNIQVSATIRLHQIKYAQRTGIPPANRGMLMFYNFGRIRAESDHSSIFNERDAGRYAAYISKYKLPLDISLPIFSWGVHSRDRKVVGLINKVHAEDFVGIDGFLKIAANKIRVTKSFFYRGTYYSEGDLLLLEGTGPALTKQAANLAIRGSDWRKNYQTVAFFDIDERNLARYDKNELQQIFNQF